MPIGNPLWFASFRPQPSGSLKALRHRKYIHLLVLIKRFVLIRLQCHCDFISEGSIIRRGGWSLHDLMRLLCMSRISKASGAKNKHIITERQSVQNFLRVCRVCRTSYFDLPRFVLLLTYGLYNVRVVPNNWDTGQFDSPGDVVSASQRRCLTRHFWRLSI